MSGRENAHTRIAGMSSTARLVVRRGPTPEFSTVDFAAVQMFYTRARTLVLLQKTLANFPICQVGSVDITVSIR
jgi:hypothetical protein